MALPGYRPVTRWYFAVFIPVTVQSIPSARALRYQLTTAPSFGQKRDGAGFWVRCGFLGLLHMEIIQERLEREYIWT